jgi:hypothetical protein
VFLFEEDFMRRQVATVSLAFTAIFAFAAVGAQAQTAPAQADSTGQASSTSSSSATPEGQSAQNTLATTNTPTDSAAPAKRVWTNDDVHELRRDAPISTVGVKARPQKNVGAANKQVANPETIRSYHDRIIALQDKLPPIDSQITDLQGVLNGQTMNSTRHATGAKIDDWHDELTRLQQQRSDIETRIGALQDEARHKGVPENQIPQ